MSQLYMMFSILDRNKARKFLDFYQDSGIEVNFSTVARGTAASEVLDYFGLESIERIMITSIVTGETWKKVRRGLQKKMNIDIPGTGIAFVIPLSSIGGKKQLQFLTQNQNYEIEEESTLKDTKYELLVVITNQGYTNLVMDAARKEQAGGGTVIHAKGTGMEGAAQFFGISLASEKEIIFIVVKREDKNRIMKAIMTEAGMESKARSIVFSLPVTSTAGMRFMEEPEED
ncbi:MAG: P-II family nitrogen regulator [Lachnospiraceae bacterium]|nr:P-II family nitrogen regulator [Lachnospiraceae bacterium]MDY4971378.1 P-II family nitrogen regulator [Lachnospiraceae bacterium]